MAGSDDQIWRKLSAQDGSLPLSLEGGWGRGVQVWDESLALTPGAAQVNRASEIPRRSQLFPAGLSPTCWELHDQAWGRQQLGFGRTQARGQPPASCGSAADEAAERSASFFLASSSIFCLRAPVPQHPASLFHRWRAAATSGQKWQKGQSCACLFRRNCLSGELYVKHSLTGQP